MDQHKMNSLLCQIVVETSPNVTEQESIRIESRSHLFLEDVRWECRKNTLLPLHEGLNAAYSYRGFACIFPEKDFDLRTALAAIDLPALVAHLPADTWNIGVYSQMLVYHGIGGYQTPEMQLAMVEWAARVEQAFRIRTQAYLEVPPPKYAENITYRKNFIAK